MGLDVMIGLVTIMVAIIGVGVTLGRLARKHGEKLEGLRGELKGDIKDLRGELQSSIKGLREEVRGDIGGVRDELRGEIKGVRTELGGRIDAVAAELTRTRMAVARIEGSVLGVPLPDTGTDPG
ncbi:MAG: hypothetical protein OXN85_09475 [Gemmatimonadetes bacterium]|nr:hypothetical protein [Candidatus Palauibacter australiensis]